MPRMKLHNLLLKLGFKSEDDFYFLDRPDKASPWQSISILDIDVFLGGLPVYETNEDVQDTGGGKWDWIKISYNLSSLPENFIDVSCAKIFHIAEELGLKVYYKNEEIHETNLLRIFKSYCEDLKTKYAAPGSEDLALIMQYF